METNNRNYKNPTVIAWEQLRQLLTQFADRMQNFDAMAQKQGRDIGVDEVFNEIQNIRKQLDEIQKGLNLQNNTINTERVVDKSQPETPFSITNNNRNDESKNMKKKLIRLTESDLHKIVKESAKRIMKEVALKGKSGKTYSLHGTDPESWAVMSRVRGKNGYFPNTPQHYHACRDEDNWIELDDKAHPNLRSRNNANRINAMMNRIDDKSKDIMAANESKLSRIVKESVEKILSESEYDNFFDWVDNSSASPEEIEAASQRHYSRIPSIKSPTDKLARRERVFNRRASMNDPDIGERIANRKDFIKNQRQGERFRQRITK